MLTSHCSSSTICASLEWCKDVKATLQHIAEIKAGHPFRGTIAETREGNGEVIKNSGVDGDAQINWQALARATKTGRKPPNRLKKGKSKVTAQGTPKERTAEPHTTN